MKGLSKATMIIAKVIEVVCWIGVAAMLVLLVWGLFTSPETLAAGTADVAADGDVAALGFSVTVNGAETAALTRGAVIVFSVFGAALVSLVAMVFRNVYLIIKTSRGETKFSKGATPFQPDNIRMLRQIGIFTIAIPILELIVSILTRVIFGADYVEASVDMGHIFLGILVLWLTQVFAYGAELQGDSDGLI